MKRRDALAWNRHVARSARKHFALPAYWDADAATDNHNLGLFNRTTGAQVHPELIKALVEAPR